MATLTMPSSSGFSEYHFQLITNTLKFVSPQDKSIQVNELPGARWAAFYELPPMEVAVAADWIAFMAQLDGMTGTFYGYDPARTSPRGSAGGTPKVNGASQTGKTLITDGWPASQSGILKNYDMFHFTTPTSWREMHMIVGGDADSDGGGNSTLTIRPALREPPAEDADIIVASPSCVMALINDDSNVWDVNEAAHFGLRFQAVEVFA